MHMWKLSQMFVPLLVASHNAVTTKLIEVKKFKLAVKFAVALDKILSSLNRLNYYQLCGAKIVNQIEPNKQINCLKIGKTWRIAPMRVAFKKDDL